MPDRAPTGRRNHGRGHSYLLDGERVDGVTWVIGQGIPKPALIDWAARTTAEFAVDHWDELNEETSSKRLRTLERARWETSKAAMAKGTIIHKFAMGLAAGQEVDVPEEIVGYVDAYLRFVKEWEPREILVEVPIFNRTLRYAGTLDLIADLADGNRWLIDWKTGASGIWPESAVQLAAYRNAEFFLDADGREQPLPDVDFCGCVWLRDDGYDLHPVEASEHTFRIFQYARQVAQFGQEPRDRWVDEVPAAADQGRGMSAVVPHTRQPAQTVDVPLEGRHRWVALLAEVAQLAHVIAATDFVPKQLRGNEAAIAAAILYGDEIGLTPMQSLAKIAIIDGKPAIAAEAQRALILAAGHYIWPEELGTTKVTWAGRRADNEQITRVTWTLDDAKRANLAGRQNRRTYPRAMLSARASAELARAVFADVIGGLAATEELEDVAPGNEPPEASTEPPPTAPTRRRRPTRQTTPVVAPTPPTSQQATPPEPPLPGEPGAPPAPKASDAQLRKLFALTNEAGMRDRDDRLDWINQHIDHTVVSSSELTDVEVSTLIDALDERAVQAPPDETGPAETPGLESDSSAPARPDVAASHGASGPAAPAELPLDPNLVTSEALDVLSWMRREAEVSDDWLRSKLAELGIESVPKKITRAAMGRLTRDQAQQLKTALNAEIDARRSEG